MKLLHIDSSILAGNSVSRILSAEVVAEQKKRDPNLKVIYRDLAAAPLQHLSGAHLAAAQAGQNDLPASLTHDIAQGHAALEEFLAADIVVIGAPMYNFGVSSQLKAWIDRISVAGKTFKYVEGKGPVGLAGGKKVIIASSRGGMYADHPVMSAFEHQESYLKSVFQFFGITDVTFVRAEGVAMAKQRDVSIAAARRSIAALA